MAKQVIKNSTDIPFEGGEHTNFDEKEEVSAGTDELDELEPEQIAEILRKQEPVETPTEKETEEKEEEEEEEIVDEDTLLKELVDDKDKTVTETEDNDDTGNEFNLPDKLKGKSLEEIAKMYINAEKLGSAHTTELGELRKQKAELATAKELAKKYEIEMSANKVSPSIKKWSPEEVATFIQELGKDPQKAFAELITPYIKPLATSTAQTRNERMEEKLTNDNKDKIVPYDRAEVSQILKAQPELWKEYGTKAIQVAFNIYKENVFDDRMEAKETEFNEKLKEQANNKDKEQATHTVGVHPAGKKQSGGNIKEAIKKLNKMDADKAVDILNKILPHSDRKR